MLPAAVYAPSCPVTFTAAISSSTDVTVCGDGPVQQPIGAISKHFALYTMAPASLPSLAHGETHKAPIVATAHFAPLNALPTTAGSPTSVADPAIVTTAKSTAHKPPTPTPTPTRSRHEDDNEQDVSSDDGGDDDARESVRGCEAACPPCSARCPATATSSLPASRSRPRGNAGVC